MEKNVKQLKESPLQNGGLQKFSSGRLFKVKQRWNKSISVNEENVEKYIFLY